MKKSGLRSFVFVAILAITGCQNQETIKIGAIISTEGPAGPVAEGIAPMEGLTMAVEEINASGGINGRKIELIHENPAMDTQKAIEMFQKMENTDKPLFYLSTLSFMSMALAPLAEEANVALVATIATTPALTKNRDWIFRYWPTAEKEVPVILSLIEQLKIGRLGVLYLDDDYGRSIFTLLDAGLKKRGVAVEGTAFANNTTDFENLVASVLDNDMIYFLGFSSHVEPIAAELVKQGYSGLKLAPNAAAVPSVRSNPAMNGVYVTIPIIYNPNYFFAHEFKRGYEDRYKKPVGHYAPPGYDLLKLLADLLTDKKLERSSVTQVLEQGFIYSGVFGDLYAEAGDHDIGFPLYFAQIVNGEIIYR